MEFMWRLVGRCTVNFTLEIRLLKRDFKAPKLNYLKEKRFLRRAYLPKV
uniref:Uncharacterized protein n=1 Tax=Meloidogyne enterolobii TaxID=390850 RepID=A0A6V7VUE5_MELEN|nr:unnamed protein product [Meloidogyne enterolobii]